MRNHGLGNSLCFAALAVSTACLAGAYLPHPGWAGSAAVGGVVLLQAAAWTRPFKSLASINLALYTGLAGIRLLEGAASLPLAVGTTAALAYWELVQFRNQRGAGSSVETNPALSRYHLQSVGLAAGLGLLLVVAGWAVHLPLPFGIAAGLVLVLFLGLERVLRWFISGGGS